jgi:AraC-like DNA-binding protein
MSTRASSPQVVTPEAFFQALFDLDASLAMHQYGASRCFETWAVQPRSISDHLVYMVTESSLHGRVGSRRIRLDPGGMCWVMPGVEHEFWLESGQLRPRIYHFKISLQAASGRRVRLSQEVLVANEASALRPSCDDVSREAASNQPLAGFRLRAGLTSLLSGLVLAAGQGRLGPTLDARQRALIVELLERHPQRRPSTASLAKAVNLQEDYFTRVFRRTYGVAPRSWIVRERMQDAAARLRDSELSIEDIASALGYGTIFLFSRQFKQVFGRSPTAYRRDV